MATPLGLSLSKSIPGYYNAEMLLTTSETAHPYVISDPGPAFSFRKVTMSGEPKATFSGLYGLRSGAVIRYGAIDRDGKFIEGTGGELGIISSNPEFQLPFKALYENPEARLLVEYQFDDGKDAEPWAEYYDLPTLDQAFKNRTAIRYGYYTPRVNMFSPISPKTATVRSLDGQSQNIDITATNKVLRLQSGDVIDVPVATGRRVIAAATVLLKQYRNGNSVSEPTVTTTAPVTVLEAGSWAFTPNHYATLRLQPAGYLTPGYLAQLVLQLSFTDGTTGSLTICYGMEDDHGSTAQNEQRILELLQGTDLFPTDRMELRVKDADVEGHTKNIIVQDGYPLQDYRLSFDPNVAKVYDSINVKYSCIPSKNPFTWGVERRGDEYIVRGYVYDRGEGMENFSNPENSRDFDFYFNDIKKSTDYSYTSYERKSSIPYFIGYLEGKAVITTSGEVRFSWNGGRMCAHNNYRTPQKNLKSSYFDWGLILAGELDTRLTIQAPDGGGDPTHPFNFNLKEDSYTEINALTGHNGQDIQAGIYAQEEDIKGKAEAEVWQKAVYRPYQAGGGTINKTIDFWTEGDLRLYRGYRVFTDDTGMAESAETTIPLWCASYWRRIYDVSGSNNDSLTGYYPQRWTVTLSVGTNPRRSSAPAAPLASPMGSPLVSPSVSSLAAPSLISALSPLMVGSIDRPSLAGQMFATTGALAAPSMRGGAGMAARRGVMDPLPVAQYFDFNNGAEALTPGTGDIPGSAFSLAASSTEGGITVAAWGTHHDDFDPAVLDTFDATGAIKYATGMTEIAAGVYSGGDWNTVSLTENSLADVTPKTATNGAAGLVVWYQGAVDVVDGDSETAGIQPRVSVKEGRLMSARYNGSTWSKPATLYTPNGENITDYAVAMAADGSALVTAVTDSGRIVLLRIAANGNISLVEHQLGTAALTAMAALTGAGEPLAPVFTSTSLVYNGEDYTLACFDAANLALTLHELSTEGSVLTTRFSGVPAKTKGEFELFRDWAKTGAEAVVLLWPGTVTGQESSDSDGSGDSDSDSGNSGDSDSSDDSEDGAAEAVLYASRMLAEAGSGTVLVSAPLTAFSQDGVASISSYDAYINGNTFKVLVACKDRNISEDGAVSEGGSAYLAEAEAALAGTISTSAAPNDLAGLVPGIPADLQVKVKNNGFAAITGIKTQIDGGNAVTTTVNLLPNDELTVTVPYTPERNLPDSVSYSVTVTFADDCVATANGTIELLETDLAVRLLSFTPENNKAVITALISNKTSFSLSGKTVVAGIYQDAFGTEPVAEEKTINGNEFEAQTAGSTFGAAVAADFTLNGVGSLPPTLYLIVRTYDASNVEIPDSDRMDNTLIVANEVKLKADLEQEEEPGKNNGKGNKGGKGEETFTVTFETNGGSAIESISITVKGKITVPLEPIREGYIFGGRFSDKELTKEFNFNKNLKSDTVVYAKWTKTAVDPNNPLAGWQNPFIDVKEDDWFYGDVVYAQRNGLFAGTGANTFSPNASMTRAMMATVLWRMAGCPSADGTSFTDVAGGLWYSEAVAWAKANNIVSGIGGGLFDPDAAITREQLAAILYRYEQFTGKIPANLVADREMADADTISDYAKNAVQVLVAQGIIGGKPGNIFDPQGTATRAEVAAMLHRFITLQ